MNSICKAIASTLLSLTLASTAMAIPGKMHDKYGSMLRGTPAEQGGVGSWTTDQIKALNRWMDQPATTPGRYKISKSGKPLSPWNHNEIRHDPSKVARVFSGNGTVSKEALNAARTHVVGDMLNKRPVNGWEITSPRQASAKRILSYVEANRRLPSNLPRWVLQAGKETDDLIKGATLKLSPKLLMGKTGTIVAIRQIAKSKDLLNIKITPTSGGYFFGNHIFIADHSIESVFKDPKLAAKLNVMFKERFQDFAKKSSVMPRGGIAGQVGIFVFVSDSIIALNDYSQGHISNGDLKIAISEAGLRSVVVAGGIKLIVITGIANPTLIPIGIVTIGAYAGTNFAISSFKENFGNKPLDLTLLRNIAPSDVPHAILLSDFYN